MKKHLIVICLVSCFGMAFPAMAECITGDYWFRPQDQQTLPESAVLQQLPASGIVLLGEHHSNAGHHQWQLRMIKALYQQRGALVIGLEMQPRNQQAVLDQWVAGKLSENEFLQQSHWLSYWSSNFDDYFPILDFARQKRIPLIALNVSQSLLQMVQTQGWEQIPENHREGVGEPARPGKHYVKKLAASFAKHKPGNTPLNKQEFLKFYQQQLIWDRAMAEKLAEALKEHPRQLIVGMMGSWHMIDQEGVPFQLRDLGVSEVKTLVPWDPNLSCTDVTPRFADLIYGMHKKQAASR